RGQRGRALSRLCTPRDRWPRRWGPDWTHFGRHGPEAPHTPLAQVSPPWPDRAVAPQLKAQAPSAAPGLTLPQRLRDPSPAPLPLGHSGAFALLARLGHPRALGPGRRPSWAWLPVRGGSSPFARAHGLHPVTCPHSQPRPTDGTRPRPGPQARGLLCLVSPHRQRGPTDRTRPRPGPQARGLLCLVPTHCQSRPADQAGPQPGPQACGLPCLVPPHCQLRPADGTRPQPCPQARGLRFGLPHRVLSDPPPQAGAEDREPRCPSGTALAPFSRLC
ncbi:hypothetical protein chiPu_0028258, partial [Chiloscyllium punctatum]|nr:hypothetical protein [Chiloscyllium punctatum]